MIFERIMFVRADGQVQWWQVLTRM